MVRSVSMTLSALALAGCFFPADRGRVVEARLDRLTQENERLNGKLLETRGLLDETESRLKQALEQLDAASRTTGANIGVKLDQALQDVAMLRGNVESVQHKLGDVEQKMQTQATERPAGTTAEPKREEVKRPEEPKAYLALADEKAQSGENELARKLYEEFLKKWPRDDYAGEAHFKLGETFFGEQKCREALYEYGKVIQEYAKTKSAPSAYLRSSDCFKELKMPSESKLALQELVKQFPKSDAAKTAKQKLADFEKKKDSKGGKK